MAGRRRPRAESRGGGGHTPKRGWAAGQHFESYHAYRDAFAKRAGYENYDDRQSYRQYAREVLGHELRAGGLKFRFDPKGEYLLLRAHTEGKLMGQAKRSGNRTAQAQHRRNMDFALLDLQIERPDFSVEQDFWSS